MAKSKDTNFYATDLDLDPANYNPDIGNDSLAQTLARMFGRDIINRIWRGQTVDYNGRTRITNGPAITSGIVPRTVTVLTTTTMLLDNNPTRQLAYLAYPSGQGPVTLAQVDPGVASFGILWPQSEDLFMDGYTGQLFARSSVASSNVLVWEF